MTVIKCKKTVINGNRGDGGMRVSCRLSGMRTPYPQRRALSPLQGDTKFCPSLYGRLLFVVSVAGDTSVIKKGCNFPYNYDKI